MISQKHSIGFKICSYVLFLIGGLYSENNISPYNPIKQYIVIMDTLKQTISSSNQIQYGI